MFKLKNIFKKKVKYIPTRLFNFYDRVLIIYLQNMKGTVVGTAKNGFPLVILDSMRNNKPIDLNPRYLKNLDDSHECL